MNGLEIYNEILQNTHNLKGTWEVTGENYLKVDGMTNGSIVLFDQTVGALGDFILEWTAEQKGGSYIHSNLCPSLRYTPEDAGTEGGGDNYAMLVYLCNYGGNPGTFNLRTENGTKSTVNTSGVSLNLDTVYTFKFERIKGKYRLYQDGVLINEASDITDKKLYLGWYLWYGGSNSDYQTNFILREYSITKINTYHYLDTLGLTTLWSKIKSLFATKTELSAKADNNSVVHLSGNETIAGTKTFSSNIVGNLKGNADTATKATTVDNSNSLLTANGSHIIQNDHGSFYAYDNNRKAFVWNSTDGNAYFYGQADRALQDSDGNQINTTYLATNWYNNVGAVSDGILQVGSSGGTYCKLRHDGVFSGNIGSIKPNDNQLNLGDGSNRWATVFAVTGSINTSDERQKDNIKQIDDKLLNAWENVNLVQFNFKDALEKKGNNARVHTGYIAQDVKEELNKYGIDACKYGLFCYDSWDAQEEQSHEEERTDDEGNTKIVKVIDTPAREAGETYGLRYIECLIVECAYLRKKNKELEDRITRLEENLNA